MFFVLEGPFDSSPAIYRWVRKEVIHESWKDGWRQAFSDWNSAVLPGL